MNINVSIAKYMKSDTGRIVAVEYSAVLTHVDYAGVSSHTAGIVVSDLDNDATITDMKGFISSLILGDANLLSVHLSDLNFKDTLANAVPYSTAPEPTLEELRAQMPDKTPREFRDILTDMGIFPHMVSAKINEIPFDIERQKALNAWEVSTHISRTDPYVDMIGVMFDKSPAEIDTAWLA